MGPEAQGREEPGGEISWKLRKSLSGCGLLGALGAEFSGAPLTVALASVPESRGLQPGSRGQERAHTAPSLFKDAFSCFALCSLGSSPLFPLNAA